MLRGGPSQSNVLKPCNNTRIHTEVCSNFCSSCFLGQRDRGSATPNISSWTTVTGRRQRERHADMQPRDRPTAWHHCGESGTKEEECCRRAGRSPWRQATARSSPHTGLCGSTVKWRNAPRAPIRLILRVLSRDDTTASRVNEEAQRDGGFWE